MIKKECHLTTIDNRSLDLKPAFQADIHIKSAMSNRSNYLYQTCPPVLASAFFKDVLTITKDWL